MRNIIAAIIVLSLASAALAEEQKMDPKHDAFACDLYAGLAGGDGNLFFSPASIQTALAMTWAGARGATADEMAKTLRLDPKPETHEHIGGFLQKLNADGKDRGYELSIANALWGPRGYPFLPDYLKLVQTRYGGNLSELDFLGNAEGSRKTINDWVSQQTHDKIKDLLPRGAIKPDTRLVLTNAIYFKARWDHPFRKERTKEDQFIAAGGKQVAAAFMTQQAHFQYAEDDDVQVLEMTYGRNDLAMRVYLPKKTDGLSAFEKQMSQERLSKLVGALRREEVIVSIPKFKMETSFELSERLKAMGMKLAFDIDQADFSGMTSAEKFYIGMVLHKAFVNVDENGTEAAAATAVMMLAGSARMQEPPKPKVFKADHPFVFEIVHQASGTTLFMGRVATP